MHDIDMFSLLLLRKKGGGGEQPTLNAPTISANANVITITNPSTNGNFVTGYGVYVDETHIEDITTTSYTVSDAHLGSITVKAKGSNFIDSEASNSVTVAKYSITVTCVDCTEASGNPTSIYNNGDSVTLYFTMNEGKSLLESGITVTNATIYSLSTEESSLTLNNAVGNVLLNVEGVTVSNSLAFTSNGDGTCYVSGIGECTDTDIVIPNTSPLGDTVIRIGGSAFQGINTINSVSMPNSITSLGNAIFYNCKGLTSVTLSNNITILPNALFGECNHLTSILIHEGITEIGTGCFANCTVLQNVTIPNSVIRILQQGFYNCKGFTSITIPDNVTTIGGSAFNYCDNVISVYIGSGVTSIGSDAFGALDRLTSITVNENNLTFKSSGNCLINKTTNTLILGCSSSVIPLDENITTIGEKAFLNVHIVSVILPSTLTTIGNYSFSNTDLASISFPSSVTAINNFAFRQCYSLAIATFNGTPTSISSVAFQSDSSLRNIYVPWSEGAVADAPWGATNATIHYIS